ncbi:MAG: C10 family peptidase [Muribaculaceae bacterium]|nr:C10 family peptidase [Muribaculaceae bacterium]
MRHFVFLFLFLTYITSVAQEIPALLKAKYNQSYPYNLSCPDNSVTGCGPTAIAEILNFYKQPAHGFGKANLILDLDTIEVDMESIIFDWDNILDSYPNNGFSELEAKSIADLMYACGVAMDVNYGSSTSVQNNAWMLWGLHHNLHLSPDSRYLHRQHYSTAEWLEIIDKQLRDGHPVFYRGTWLYGNSRADHMFAIDGLDDNGNYHVNFGHGGLNDKFCNINVLNQTGEFPGGKGVCYNASQAMVINCYPTPDFDDYPMQACISEEAIILNNDINLNNIEIELGDTFTLSCRLRNYANEKANISFGWALIKDNELLSILGQGKYSLSRGYTFKEASHRTIKLPKDLNDGDYKLILYSKSDIEPEWKEVWKDAATEVNVQVRGGIAAVTIPDNHQLDPCLFLAEPISEIENEYSKTTPGRLFAMTISNNTTNNFQNKIRLDIEVEDGQEYSYETILPVFSQTSIPFHVLLPKAAINLQDKAIKSLKAYYYYDIDKKYVELTTSDPTLSVDENIMEECSGVVEVYSISGILLKKLNANEIVTEYGNFLSNLPHGIYVIKEGTKTRKIVK